MSLNNLNKPTPQNFTIAEMCRRRLLMPKKLETAAGYRGLTDHDRLRDCAYKHIGRFLNEEPLRTRKPKPVEEVPRKPRRMGRKRKYFYEDVERIFKMLEHGTGLRTIAELHDVKPANISNVIYEARKYGIDSFPTKAEHAAWLQELREGKE